MGSDGANTLDLVGSNGNTETSAADEKRAVDFTVSDELSGCSGADGVGGLVAGFAGADVDDFSYAGV